MSGEHEARALITVIGEALIDLVPGPQRQSFIAHPGGSPYNVAIGLARLGQRTALMARLADNAFGRVLREGAAAEGICLDAAPLASEPTTLAVVSLNAEAQATYDFYREGTADWQWTAEEISRAPDTAAVLHFGSLASWTPPGDEHILWLASRLRGRGDVLVSYDPNVRPRLLYDQRHGQRMVERSIRLAHLAKASAEDIAWLYPDRTVDDVALHWRQLGAAVVVITDGASGASAYTATGPPIHRPALDVTVVDTVGAGDAFTAGLLGSLVQRDLHSPAQLARCSAPQLSAALDDAILVATLTCQRAGNDPPTIAELESERGRRSRRSGHDADMDEVGRRAHAAIAAGDWAALRPLLHPYLHWTDAQGRTLRGRSRVLAMLAQSADAPARAASIELRDGQIYRWRAD